MSVSQFLRDGTVQHGTLLGGGTTLKLSPVPLILPASPLSIVARAFHSQPREGCSSPRHTLQSMDIDHSSGSEDNLGQYPHSQNPSPTGSIPSSGRTCSSSGEGDGAKGQRKKYRKGVYRGVRQRSAGKWVAEVKDTGLGVRKWLGTFSSPESAALAFDEAMRHLRGPGAATNFPAGAHLEGTQPPVVRISGQSPGVPGPSSPAARIASVTARSAVPPCSPSAVPRGTSTQTSIARSSSQAHVAAAPPAAAWASVTAPCASPSSEAYPGSVEENIGTGSLGGTLVSTPQSSIAGPGRRSFSPSAAGSRGAPRRELEARELVEEEPLGPLQGSPSGALGMASRAEVVELLAAALGRVGPVGLTSGPQALSPPAVLAVGIPQRSAHQGYGVLDAATLLRDLKGALAQRQPGGQQQRGATSATQYWHEHQAHAAWQLPDDISTGHEPGPTLESTDHPKAETALHPSSFWEGPPAVSYSAAQARSLEEPPLFPQGAVVESKPQVAAADALNRLGSRGSGRGDNFSPTLESSPPSLADMWPGGAGGWQAFGGMQVPQQPAPSPSGELSLEEIEKILMDT